jgi:putative hemolysin
MVRNVTACIVLILTVLTSVTAQQSVSARQIEATPVPPTQPADDLAPDASSSIPDSLESASEYCLLRGGVLVQRFPFVGNPDGDSIQLSGSRWFCEFSGSEEAEPPTSRISVALSTLYATGPTLAAIAYLAPPPVPEIDDTDDLAHTYCAHLGGSSLFGSDPDAGGGWASDPTDPLGTSIGICVFPDGSAIDDWGLAYRANGVIRGANLETILRYQPENAPTSVFPSN